MPPPPKKGASSDKRILKWKKLWFDSERVGKMMTRKKRKALNRFGSTTRKHAQYSMKSRKAKSAAGEPPSAHLKTLKRLLFYSFDPSTEHVVVGPVRLEETAEQHVPRTHEVGGTIVTIGEHGKPETRNYPPRPYMKPAFEKHVGRIAQWYAES